MRKPTLALMSAAAMGLLTVGCGNKAVQAKADNPEDLLKWSMDQYHHAKSFSTGVDFKIASVGFGINVERKRTLDYQAPNLYRVVTTLLPSKTQITCVSDGTNEIDYSDNVKAKAMKSPAPPELNTVSSEAMQEPAISGSLIYSFFGGSENIGELEQQTGDKATWGPDGTAPNGEPTKTVRFLTTGKLGHAEATIGTKTGLVYKLSFDAQPLVSQYLRGHTPEEAIEELKKVLANSPKGVKRDVLQKAIDTGPSVYSIACSETFIDPKFDAPVEVAMFKANVPKGEAFSPPKPDGLAPVPVGQAAPDITVRDTSGNALKLSSLRGHVVMLDFWATWCNPCRETLPVTAALAQKYAGKGLRVLAISAEDSAKVAQFVKQQTYKLPAYLEKEDAATYAYHIDKLPTTVIIDARGNLSDYLPGVNRPEDLQVALARAGLNIGS